MAWKDVQAWVRSLFGGRGEATSRRPDGGTSCYRPVQRKNRKEEELAREKAAEYAQAQLRNFNSVVQLDKIHALSSCFVSCSFVLF